MRSMDSINAINLNRLRKAQYMSQNLMSGRNFNIRPRLNRHSSVTGSWLNCRYIKAHYKALRLVICTELIKATHCKKELYEATTLCDVKIFLTTLSKIFTL